MSPHASHPPVSKSVLNEVHPLHRLCSLKGLFSTRPPVCCSVPQLLDPHHNSLPALYCPHKDCMREQTSAHRLELLHLQLAKPNVQQ